MVVSGSSGAAREQSARRALDRKAHRQTGGASVARCHRRLPLVRLLQRSSTSLLEMREERIHLLAFRPRLGIRTVLYLAKSASASGSPSASIWFRLGDIARQPSALAHRSHMHKVRTVRGRSPEQTAGEFGRLPRLRAGRPIGQNIICPTSQFGDSGS